VFLPPLLSRPISCEDLVLLDHGIDAHFEELRSRSGSAPDDEPAGEDADGRTLEPTFGGLDDGQEMIVHEEDARASPG
jgi:hypothetical protein